MPDMNVEDFRALPVAEKRKALVDWDVLVESLKGKIFTIEDVKAKVLAYKEKFNYSEWYRVVTKLDKEVDKAGNKVHTVEVRQGKDGTTLYALDLPAA